MKSFALPLLASLLALTTAVPLEKRVLVVETTTDVVFTTVQATTTLLAPPTNAAAPVPAPVVQEPAEQAVPAPQPPAPVDEAPSSPAPTLPVATPAAPAPVDNAPSSPAPARPVAPLAAALAPQPNSGSSAKAISGSAGQCGAVGGSCSGDITFYDTGLGACGWTNDGRTEKVFALAAGMMGPQSNGNPFCGRQAEISVNGKTAIGRLVDKCGGCDGQDIDLSHALFQELASEPLGRIPNVAWHFIT
ncbi:MAG: hypothetical protein Q9196_002546 [Gyalolechia fulgens]